MLRKCSALSGVRDKLLVTRSQAPAQSSDTRVLAARLRAGVDEAERARDEEVDDEGDEDCEWWWKRRLNK
jgi:hypothetical protein